MGDLMENLDEYISRYQKYNEENYEYDPITSPYDIRKTVEDGRKIVFIGSNHEAIPPFLVGGIFFLTLLIVSIVILSSPLSGFILYLTFIILLVISGIPGITFLCLGLWYRSTHFMVLGAEGIAYKLRTRGIKGYKWENINMDFYNYSAINSGGMFPSLGSVKIHIFMPNGDFIKVEPQNFTCREISVSRYLVNEGTLLMLIFVAYYDYGKNKTFKWETRKQGEPKIRPKTKNSVIGTDMVVIDTWRDQLKEAMYNHKKRNYDFSKISTSAQIQDLLLRKKVIVLKGGLGIPSWIMILIPLILPIMALSVLNPFYETFNLIEFLSFILIMGLFWFSLCSPLILILKGFLVLNSSGVYYRKFIRKRFFAWDDVSKIEGTTKEDYPNLSKDFALVKVFLLNGKKVNFASNKYKNRQFSKKVYTEMFFNLFNINFQLTRHRIY
jgi:hypothetical protein